MTYCEWPFYARKEKTNIKQNFELFPHAVKNLRSFEQELVKLLDYEMISIFLEHPVLYLVNIILYMLLVRME